MLEQERRKHVRRTVRYRAWIAIQAAARIDCILVDISEGGAKVQLTENADVPDEFDLLLSPQGSARRPCKVVWRSDQQIGVRFAPGWVAGADLDTIIKLL